VNNNSVNIRLADLTNKMDLMPSYDLITCISTIENIGLGRYGDPLDTIRDLKMMDVIRKLYKPGGFVVIAFPCHLDGEGYLVYNAHRLYA
jgi:hypothetical protein